MADESKKEKKKDSDSIEGGEDLFSKGSTIVNIILAVLLGIIIIAGFCVCVKLDVGGFGSGVLRPVMKDWPVIKYILPPASKKEKDEESEYPYNNLDEAVEALKDLQSINDKLQQENDDINIKMDELKKENERLEAFEQQQEAFEIEKAQFEEDIVLGDDALDVSEYQTYYESIQPDKAAEIYQKVLEQQQASEEIMELANTYAKMDTKTAATALEQLGDNLTMVCDILTQLSEKNRAAIMDEMTAEFAAKVTEKIYTDNN